MTGSLMNIPRKHVNEIINHFVNNTHLTSKISVYNPGENDRELLDGDCVLMVIEGYIALKRERDNIIMASFDGPYIIKLCASGVFSKLSLSNYSNFSYITCKRSEFYNHICEHNLWSHILAILEYSTFLLYSKIEMMTHGSVYDNVKFYLSKLHSNPALCQKENACQYIVGRTGFSKSGVMAILNELRKGGYIAISRGKLTGINKLPLKF